MEAEAASATDAVRLQENRVQEARERVKRAQRVLTDAAREVEILERHRQRLESRFRREQDRKEAVEHDDAGNIIYLRRRQQL
jgi:flagellar biosynthesis chaperone FliJ